MKVWIGDPCYHDFFSWHVGNEEQWSQILEKTDYFNISSNIEFNGRLVAGHSTAYGDGCYYDQIGNDYGVDSGTIGFVEWKDGDQENVNMHLIEFDGVPHIRYEDGDIIITDGRTEVCIETDPVEEEYEEHIYTGDEYDDDEWLNEEDDS